MLSFFSDGSNIISASWNISMKMRDLNTGQCLNARRGHSYGIFCIAISHELSIIVFNSEDFNIIVWNVEKGNRISTVQEHTSSVCSTVIICDGCKVISGSVDTSVKVWSLHTEQCLSTFYGHSGVVYTLLWSLLTQQKSSLEQQIRVLKYGIYKLTSAILLAMRIVYETRGILSYMKWTNSILKVYFDLRALIAILELLRV